VYCGNCYSLFVPGTKKAHPEQLGVKPGINCTFPPFFPPLTTIIDFNQPVFSMISAIILLLLLLVSLPALPAGYRPQNNAIFGTKPPDKPDSVTLGLISSSGFSGCYFDTSPAVWSLSVARLESSLAYLSPDDLVKYNNSCQVMSMSFFQIFCLRKFILAIFIQNYYPSSPNFGLFFSGNISLSNFGLGSFRAITLPGVRFFNGEISLPRDGCLFFGEKSPPRNGSYNGAGAAI
jgi:hypothetical protein